MIESEVEAVRASKGEPSEKDGENVEMGLALEGEGEEEEPQADDEEQDDE